MILKTVVCSGVNEKNDITDTVEFLRQHPGVEFGVQCSLKKASFQTARFEWLKELTSKLEEVKIAKRVALHLNEEFAVSFCEGKIPEEVEYLLKQNDSVGRLQLNFKIGRETFAGKKVPDIAKIVQSMHAAQNHPVILSASESNITFIQKMHHNGIKFDVLFDDSFGEGIAPSTRKAPLFNDVFQGYAGGLAEENVAAELVKISKIAPGNIFIDAEGKLKEDGAFSFTKAEKFVQNAFEAYEYSLGYQAHTSQNYER